MLFMDNEGNLLMLDEIDDKNKDSTNSLGISWDVVKKKLRDANNFIADSFVDAMDAVQGGMEDTIFNVIRGTKSLKESLKDIFGNILE